MQTPRFWNRRIGILACVLAPFGALYNMAGRMRQRQKPDPLQPTCDVVCIGNINVGGTGKTPATIAIAQAIQAAGKTPVVVSKGYKGKADKPVLVDPKVHTAADVGDEPLLLSAFCQVVVGQNRAESARFAETLGADIVLLDDGFQDPKIRKDLSIVVVNAKDGFGNGLCLPAGPLREPVRIGVKRADAVIAIGTQGDCTTFFANHPAIENLASFTGAVKPLATGMLWEGRRVFAFAGIGKPEKFFDTLRALGADVVGAEPLADHQFLTGPLLTRLSAQSKMLGAQMVTTEKDAVRLPQEFRTQVLTLPVRLTFRDPEGILDLLKLHLGN